MRHELFRSKLVSIQLNTRGVETSFFYSNGFCNYWASKCRNVTKLCICSICLKKTCEFVERAEEKHVRGVFASPRFRKHLHRLLSILAIFSREKFRGRTGCPKFKSFVNEFFQLNSDWVDLIAHSTVTHNESSQNKWDKRRKNTSYLRVRAATCCLLMITILLFSFP